MKTARAVSVPILCFLLLQPAGCASSRVDLVAAGRVVVATPPDNPLHHPPTAEEVDGDLVVRVRLDADEAAPGGHLDVTITAPSGVVVQSAVIRYDRKAWLVTGRETQHPHQRVLTKRTHADYSARFTGLPPAGSIVTVTRHVGPHDQTGSE